MPFSLTCKIFSPASAGRGVTRARRGPRFAKRADRLVRSAGVTRARGALCSGRRFLCRASSKTDELETSTDRPLSAEEGLEVAVLGMG